MRAVTLGSVFLVVSPLPLALANGELTGQEVSRINAVLAQMKCRVAPDAVTKQDDQYVLSDVFCADGQFDIRLDANFKLIAKRAE